MASFPGATKSDKFRIDPNDLHVLGIDGDDDEHSFYSEEQVERALAAEKDETWLSLLENGVDSSVKVYRLAKHRGQPNAPTFVLVGQRRVMGLRAVNARRKNRGLQAFEISFEIFTLPQSMSDEEADQKAYDCYVRENEGRTEDSMQMRAIKAGKMIAPTEDGGFGGPRGVDKASEEKRFRRRVAECAKSMGVSETQVTQNLLPFLRAEEPVREAAREGKIPEGMVPTLARLPAKEQLAELPKVIEAVAKGTTTVKDAARRVSNKTRAAKGQEEVSPLPGRRVWAKVVELVNDETIALAKPASRGVPEVKGIDHLVLQFAKVLSGQSAIRTIPGLTQALRAAGFEVER